MKPEPCKLTIDAVRGTDGKMYVETENGTIIAINMRKVDLIEYPDESSDYVNLEYTATWTDRYGNNYTSEFNTPAEAINRLSWLEEQERITEKFAPTDSGDTRFNYCAEAEAIKRDIQLT